MRLGSLDVISHNSATGIRGSARKPWKGHESSLLVFYARTLANGRFLGNTVYCLEGASCQHSGGFGKQELVRPTLFRRLAHRPIVHDSPLIHHDNPVRQGQGRGAVGHQEHGPLLEKFT